MSLFIKAAEVWQPDSSGHFLILASSHYGDLANFESASQRMGFAFGEGMPGRTWAERRPLIWTDLNTEYFKRSQLAQDAGLACALSIPVFAGDFLLGIMVLFCGSGKDLSGAVEVWHNPFGSGNELKLADGYYGQLERFEWISRRLTILHGRGLPGRAWDQNRPVMINDLPNSNSFLRARNAGDCGITSGLAIPFSYTPKQVQIVTFLSTLVTPIAKRFEVWVPDMEDRYLLFKSGFCAESNDLEQRYVDTAYARGQGAIGETWLSGRPLVEENNHAIGERTAYLPFILEGKLHSIVCLVF
ncbi:MAG: GAF domain-containing protein [Pseudomonadales bacterium]|nr:GAF domain-containing protein [Pseudomonadales bacterium]